MDIIDNFVIIAQNNIAKHRNNIAEKVLEKFGYQNNVERHVSLNGILEIWMHDNVEIARMTVDIEQEPNFKCTVKSQMFLKN